MNEILNKIPDQKENQEFTPKGKTFNIEKCQIINAYGFESIVKELHGHMRKCVVSDEREQKEIEKHIESIEPKILSDFPLILSPRNDDFQTPKEQRNGNQPIEIIAPTGMQDFIDQVVVIPRKRVLDDVDVFFH